MPHAPEHGHQAEPYLIGEQLAEWIDHDVQEHLVPWLERLLCAEHFEFSTRLEETPRGLQPIPERPPLLFEWNEPFLGSGPLSQGIELPTGAVWRPALWVFGEHRVDIAHQGLPNGAANQRPGLRFTEAVQRLDLFAQLNLSGTERLLIGYRPFDREVSPDGVAIARRFSAYDFQAGDAIDGYNTDIQTLFFEGDIGEIFPNLDLYDRNQLDYGFSVGRQPLLAQQGLLLNEDRIDAVTVTRNTLSGSGILNLRMTAVYAWGKVTRNDIRPFVTRADPDAQLFALLTETDLARSTINADIVYVDSSEAVGSQLAFGLSAIQRVSGAHQRFNTSFHVLGSFPTDGETSAAGRGWLLFSRVSWTPHRTLDLVYANAFWAIDQFTSPARGPLEGGPIGGSLGLLYTVSGVGRFGPPLSNQTSQAFGGSLGYQLMFDETRTQLILEVGGRQDTSGRGDSALGAGFRFQKAAGQHWVWLVDGFVAKQESRDLGHGARVELLTRF